MLPFTTVHRHQGFEQIGEGESRSCGSNTIFGRMVQRKSQHIPTTTSTNLHQSQPHQGSHLQPSNLWLYKDLKPITSIPQLIPLDFSSRDPFGFDCWVHDVIHGFFWFRFNSLYIGFVCVVLPSIFYCWCCFLIFFFFLVEKQTNY